MKTVMIMAAALATASAVAAAATPKPDVADARSVDDGYVIGRPDAPIRITVVSSYGCPHCRVLDDVTMPAIRRELVATGRATVRFVPYALFGSDLPPTMVADCGPASRYFDRSSALFSLQREIGTGYRTTPGATVSSTPELLRAQDPLRIGQAEGLLGEEQAIGLTAAEMRRCLSDPNLRKRALARQALIAARYHVEGTPTVLVNGRPIPGGGDWNTLRNAVKQAGA